MYSLKFVQKQGAEIVQDEISSKNKLHQEMYR